ncbi:MAG: ankyrin repeat domain-containing protein [Hyphomicrobium sp.]|nr:ankyrin repeat domain-containing protein [Hyphomicrobium sp.]ODT20667.1 MAG: hypothetical protein ABS54_13845 [Hyphomicrobium sp. SCN 65-11]
MERPPPLAAELVNEFVLKAHSDLNRVKELLAKEPKLVNACWDWGGGDFETALGASAHTGRREIAEFLLDNGARMHIFAAAMLGQLDVVKAAITADPRAAKAPGPHGIPLLTHAKMGGEKAAPVLEYLQSLG